MVETSQKGGLVLQFASKELNMLLKLDLKGIVRSSIGCQSCYCTLLPVSSALLLTAKITIMKTNLLHVYQSNGRGTVQGWLLVSEHSADIHLQEKSSLQ